MLCRTGGCGCTVYGLTETVMHERLKLYGRASAWRADNCGTVVDRAQARTIFAPRHDESRVFLKFHFQFTLLKQRNSFCRARKRTIFAPRRDESRVFSKFHFQFTLLKQRNSFCRAQARTIFAPRRDGMRRAQYRFRTLRHRRTGSASRRTPPARRGIFIFSRKNEIVLDFSLAMCYNSMELKVNTVFTRRSRVAGRARTIGNRVTLNGVREFESLLLRHKKRSVFRVLFCILYQ